MEAKFSLNSQSIPGKIKIKKENINQTKTILNNILKHSKNNYRKIKKLNLYLSMEQCDLVKLERELEFQKQGNKIVISEKLERLFEIAKALKPELSQKIDRLLWKQNK